MPGRVKYPLTEATKRVARELATEWHDGRLEQVFQCKGQMWYRGFVWRKDGTAFEVPKGTLIELDTFRLIEIRPIGGRPGDENWRWEVLLLQELLNAVETNFEVSDFFLTTTAVGNIFMGGATVNAPVQGVGLALAPVTQNVQVLTGEIRALLGEHVIEAHPDIERALNELEGAPAEQLPSKGRRLIKSLAEVLQGVEQAAGVLQAIMFLSQFLQAYF